jgi:propanediol dehydratase large subunit
VERAFDPTYGAGEFILLVGVASTAIGSLVTYDGTTYQTTLAAVTSNQARPVAVAMSACTAGLFGWYQIEGTAVVSKSTSSNFAATVALGIKSVGKVGATSSGKEILGARTANAATVASATTTVTVVMNRPHLQGRVT